MLISKDFSFETTLLLLQLYHILLYIYFRKEGKNNLNILDFKSVVTESLRRFKMPRFFDHEPVTSSCLERNIKQIVNSQKYREVTSAINPLPKHKIQTQKIFISYVYNPRIFISCRITIII